MSAPHAASLRIEHGEVHLWLARTDLPDQSLARLEAPLSEQELRRAAGYRFDADRRRFVAAHGLLRALLGAYIGCAPRDVPMATGMHGKPYIVAAAAGAAGAPLHFNISHSEAWFAAAVAMDPVGVDVEVPSKRRSSTQLADIVLSPAERAAFARLPEAALRERLYSLWTRKEAVLKALGVGLTESMRSISMTVGTESPPRVTGFADDADDPAEWLLHEFAPAPGVVGALALRARAALVRSWMLTAESIEVWPNQGAKG